MAERSDRGFHETLPSDFSISEALACNIWNRGLLASLMRETDQSFAKLAQKGIIY